MTQHAGTSVLPIDCKHHLKSSIMACATHQQREVPRVLKGVWACELWMFIVVRCASIMMSALVNSNRAEISPDQWPSSGTGHKGIASGLHALPHSLCLSPPALHCLSSEMSKCGSSVQSSAVECQTYFGATSMLMYSCIVEVAG